MNIYLMNSAVMPSGCFGKYTYYPMNPETFGFYLKSYPVQSRIGYPQNIELIKNWFDVDIELNRTEVSLESGDQMLVMRMKKRIADPNTKGSPQSNNINDWEFAHVIFE